MACAYPQGQENMVRCWGRCLSEQYLPQMNGTKRNHQDGNNATTQAIFPLRPNMASCEAHIGEL